MRKDLTAHIKPLDIAEIQHSIRFALAQKRLERKKLDRLFDESSVNADQIKDSSKDVYVRQNMYGSITLNSSSSYLNQLLDNYQLRLANNVKEAEVYQKVNTTSFLTLKMKAVIDWLDLRFTVDPNLCIFYKDPKARSYIKAFITRNTGTRHYIAKDESQITQDGMSFTIRLHDVQNKKDLKKITDLLQKQYGAKIELMMVEAIELSFDLYGGDSSAVVIKLHKAMQYPQTARLFRVYKTKGTQRDIPESMQELYDLLHGGYNIGVGDHRYDEFCVRLYFKRTDKGGQSLPQQQHRARIEITLKKSIFDNETVDRNILNLSQLIKFGFKKMQFTKLSKRATYKEKDVYYTQVKPFGEEHASIMVNRHKRVLLNAIATNGAFNEAKRLAVKALAQKF